MYLQSVHIDSLEITMILMNPIQVFLWTFRRTEKDVINLYDYLSPLMELATGNNMLNFGYWKDNKTDPQTAQNKLCELIGKTVDLSGAKIVLDIGSGFSVPAFYWKSQYKEIKITCINSNFQQLSLATKLFGNSTSRQKENSLISYDDDVKFLNATSTYLPLPESSVDIIIALESAQHFRPFDQFIRESRRVLRNEGSFVIAIPIVKTPLKSPLFMKLGILSITWASEHYNLDEIKSSIIKEFNIDEISLIGNHVYEPLADYYTQNRKHIKEKILKKYPAYLENILHKSLLKMKEVSQKGIIDYAIIKCSQK